MKVIGLTGNIASGKSAVSKFLKELGAEVIDLDSLAKSLQDSNYLGVIDKIKQTFGDKVILYDNILNRKLLAKIVFHNKDELKKLNDIMIPVLTEKLILEIERHREIGTNFLVLDAAILFEAEWDKLADITVVICIPKELQLKRLIEREQIDEFEALARINAQMPIEEKIKKADIVIKNTGTIEELKEKVIEVWKKKILST
ncbi:MAG: dephospho-CoA kinase [Caldisericaceae bacterium]